MTLHYKTEGFVFKKEDRLEADRVFSVFTKDFGRIEIFGKAIRKITSKLKGGIEIFSLSEIEFIQGKNKKTLTDTLFIERFKNIQEVPEKFEVANRISKLVDNFIKGEEQDQVIFYLLNETFSKLNNCSLSNTQCSLIYYYFFWNFVSVLGYGPEISKCAVCQQKLNPHSLYFSNKEGGTICRDCYLSKKDASEIKSDVVKILRLIIKKDWDILLKLKIENNTKKLLREVSENYYNYLSSIYSFKT